MKAAYRTLLAACVALLVSANAFAETYIFGDLLSGGGPNSTSFATLEVTGQDTTQWTFSLTLGDEMATIFGDKSFVGTMAVDFLSSVEQISISEVVGSGDWNPTVSIANGSGPGGSWDFRFDFGKGSNKFGAGDTVTWVANFADVPVLTGDAFTLHVQSTIFKDNSAWYVPSTAVPEPSEYAMMGLGLALIAAVCVRRKKTA